MNGRRTRIFLFLKGRSQSFVVLKVYFFLDYLQWRDAKPRLSQLLLYSLQPKLLKSFSTNKKCKMHLCSQQLHDVHYKSKARVLLGQFLYVVCVVYMGQRKVIDIVLRFLQKQIQVVYFYARLWISVFNEHYKGLVCIFITRQKDQGEESWPSVYHFPFCTNRCKDENKARVSGSVSTLANVTPILFVIEQCLFKSPFRFMIMSHSRRRKGGSQF